MKILVNGSKEKLQEDELITYDNVMQISERIALKGLKKALSYSFNRKLYALYLGLNTDIVNKDKPDYVISDGYDLVMTAAQFLCKHIGERLNDLCGTNTKHRIITVKYACFNAVNKLITKAKKESFIMANNERPEVINMVAKERIDNEEYEKQWIKVEQTIQCMHLTDVQYDTLSCYMAGMNFEAIVKLHGVVESTVWSRRQKIKKKYIKYILNGENPF
ncbi:MAG TPA: hypothetical protein PKV66_01085 [Candidatus Pelethenecus sp.]|nr:hypothetical protein [Candidatus Pelethenecus sp.]